MGAGLAPPGGGGAASSAPTRLPGCTGQGRLGTGQLEAEVGPGGLMVIEWWLWVCCSRLSFGDREGPEHVPRGEVEGITDDRSGYGDVQAL